MKTAFVVMPFSKTTSKTEAQWTEIFDHMFKPAFVDCGYICERAKPMTGGLLESIVEHLSQSTVVLADITDHNPNVFYELGIRHALKKGTIIVSLGGDPPSDLRGLWYLQYGTGPSEVSQFKAEIKRIVATIETQPDKPDSPVSAYLEKENRMMASIVRHENAKKLGALCSELSRNSVLLTKYVKGIEKLLSVRCIELLVDTMYVDPGIAVLRDAADVANRIRILQLGNPPSNLVEEADRKCRDLGSVIRSLRERLATGAYEEPNAPTLMIWSDTAMTALEKIDVPDPGGEGA